MTQKESTNIIIALRREGWSGDKINAFIAFIETHSPSEQEAKFEQYDFSNPAKDAQPH